MSTSDSKVKCESCGREAQPNFAKCLREGWPECCGSTMRLMNTQADIGQAVGGVMGEGLEHAKRLRGMMLPGDTQEEA